MNLQQTQITPTGNDHPNGVETWVPRARSRARHIKLAFPAITLGVVLLSFNAGQPIGARPS